MYDIYMKVVRFIAEIYMNYTYGESMHDFKGNLFEFLDWGAHYQHSIRFAEEIVNAGATIVMILAIGLVLLKIIDVVFDTIEKHSEERA